MTLKEFITNNPDATFNLIPEVDDDTLDYIVRVKDGAGNELRVFIYENETEAEKAIEEAVELKDQYRIKEDLLNEAKTVLKKEGIDPDNIWSIKFGIGDFMLLSRVSPVDVAKLLNAIREDAHDVVNFLGKGLESGLLFDWETVAKASMEEII